MPELTWRAIGAGALVALLLAVPTALISQALDSADQLGDESSLPFIFAAVIIVALGIGGATAAARRPDAPMTHGILAALVAYGIVQGLGVIRRLVAGEDISWTALLFTASAAATAGLIGALVASRRR